MTNLAFTTLEQKEQLAEKLLKFFFPKQFSTINKDNGEVTLKNFEPKVFGYENYYDLLADICHSKEIYSLSTPNENYFFQPKKQHIVFFSYEDYRLNNDLEEDYVNLRYHIQDACSLLEHMGIVNL